MRVNDALVIIGFTGIILFSASLITTDGCDETPHQAAIRRADTREKTTGYRDIEVIEVKHGKKIYVIVRWHNGYGSDMELLEIKEAN